MSNSSAGLVVVRRADAVLLEPGTHRVATWTGTAGFTPTVLPPNTFAQVSFTLHVTRCRSGGQLQPGFYDLALLFVEEDATGVHRTVSPPRTVVLPP